MLSKKHYGVIAEIVKSQKQTVYHNFPLCDNAFNDAKKSITISLADYFEQDNPAKTPKDCTCGSSYLQDKGNKTVCKNCGRAIFKFDRERFMKACGL